jgi:RNA 2',3'-cyclic 3'-phosphodiesterase
MAGARRGKAGASPETIRAFVAVDLDAMSVRRVLRVADRLRMASGAPSASWTAREKVHLTLKFMASLPVDAVAPLGKALGALVDPAAPPQLGTCSLQTFPSVTHASVVVIELGDPDGDLARLATKIDKLSARHGIDREERAYRPHVTLARLKRPYDAGRWINPELAEAAGELRASRLALYRSELGAAKDGGSVYVPLATFDYGGA